VKFKLDENLSPTLAAGFISAGHEAHSTLDQTLGGAADQRVIEVCRLEGRAPGYVGFRLRQYSSLPA